MVQHWIRRVRVGGVLLLAAVLAGTVPLPSTQAQVGGTIGYGSSVFGTLAAGSLPLTYSFNGSAGDWIRASIRNWSGTLDPRLDLVAPDGQAVAVGVTNPFAEDRLEAVIALYLPQTGIFSLQVSGENGTSGDFVLKLAGRGPAAEVPLLFGQGVDVAVSQNPQPQFFGFDAQDCPTVLTVANRSEGQPFTFPFVVKVLNPQGNEIAQLYGGDALEDRLVPPPASGHYEVIVSSDDPLAQGTVHLLVTCADQAPGCVPGSATAGGVGTSAGLCPSCFAEEFGGELCDSFDVTVTRDGNTAVFTWPAVESADHYIFSVVDASRSMLLDSPRYIEEGTTNTYTFNPADLHRGPFTAIVSAGTEAEGVLCVDEALISFDGDTTDECSGITVGADVVPGAARAAVVHWSAAPGAGAYLLHIYARDPGDGGLIGIRVLTVPGDATTYHLADVFSPDYTDFQIQIGAYTEASGGGAFGDMPQGFLCSGETDIHFEPLGPVHWGEGG